MNSIYTRASIRKYQDRPVEKEKTMALLRAAMQAPSAANQQPWEFYVVTDRAKLTALGDSQHFWRMLRTAPLAIVPCIRRDCRLMDLAPTDLALCSENIMLEAVALGLGSVMLGTYPFEPRMKAVAEQLEIPDSLIPFTVLSIGYPAGEQAQQHRFDESRIHRV